MPLLSSSLGCQTYLSAHAITSLNLLDFLVPALHKPLSRPVNKSTNKSSKFRISQSRRYLLLSTEKWFFTGLKEAGTCHTCAKSRYNWTGDTEYAYRRSFATAVPSRTKDLLRWHGDTPLPCDEQEPPSTNYPPQPRGEASNPDRDHSRQQPSLARPGFFNSDVQHLSELSRLPQGFFDDVARLHDKVGNPISEEDGWNTNDAWPMMVTDAEKGSKKAITLPDQLKLLDTVRELEEKLAQAKHKLQSSVQANDAHRTTLPGRDHAAENTMTLDKEDYKGLVDLYYYTNKNRFTPEAPDYSPTPQFLDDYSFKLSDDFAGPDAYAKYYEDEEGYESPLKEVEQILRTSRLREVAVMQKFVQLLVDDTSSNRALYEVYQRLPSPGVAFLPKGIIRIFLQRMSTPAVKTGTSMLRYLSLIDDMQKAKLPITRSEWSSAIYLAGRSFGRVTQSDMAHAFRIWRQMEQEAGIKASYVTFNILFDIAVRAGKYALADNILREMHSRGLRLNRLGRVSLIYYHGLRGDGDAVRKTYRDFIDAGEIVDTLVLNCVIAALMNAGEPTAAEQTYERMKDLQLRIMQKERADGSDVVYKRYPRGGEVHMNGQMASNSLGRVLLRASHLRSRLPENHRSLQSSMPLRPDHSTFKAMIAYHANVSGDLSRLTVLINEMIETFGLSMKAVHFQLLFKGFALHGKSRHPEASWSSKRLELAWEACRTSIRDYQRSKAQSGIDRLPPSLPSAKAAVLLENDSLPTQDLSKRRRIDPWVDFMLDLAVFPRERRKPIERIHAELFDDVKLEKSRFRNPFFNAPPEQPNLQETYYPLGDSALDNEEGEYTLPSPAETIRARESRQAEQQRNMQIDDDGSPDPDEIRITRPLLCWLLRAYARCTGSRERVERVWNSARLLWHPKDEVERDSVLRVLRRCLKDCDMYGGHIL